MSEYYVRVFCPAGDPPTPQTILDWFHARELPLELKDPSLAKSKDWTRIDFVYKPNKPPMPATCLRGDEARKEADRFLAQVGTIGSSKVKKRIAKALRETRFIVAVQHPVDMDDGGYDTSGQILTYFDENNSALIQADKEGFYERSVCVLKIPDLR